LIMYKKPIIPGQQAVFIFLCIDELRVERGFRWVPLQIN
jgi:hypothetical protein